MITISVSDFNTFSQDFYDSVIHNLQMHQLECSCGHRACMSVHAYYIRSVFCPEGVFSLRICRVRCSGCGRTHALLPASLVPYQRISLMDQHKIILAYEAETDPNAICEENPSIDENVVKAVILRYRLFWLQRLLAEAITLACLSDLVKGCFTCYSMQFLQIRRSANLLFLNTT